MYVAPRTSPVAVNSATQLLAFHAPTSTSISPTNPLVPGSPTEASIMNMKNTA